MHSPDNWRDDARRLAEVLTHSGSRWHDAIAQVPRHQLVPRWFEYSADGWTVRDGAADVGVWMEAAYRSPRSMITRIGTSHADRTGLDEHPTGQFASSATHPYLVVSTYRLGQIHEGCDVLDVGTGSGYGCALLAGRLGDSHVTSIDVDPYLTGAASNRLEEIGLRPRIITGDACGQLDWEGDRIVAMVAMPGIPASWLTALRPGGRLVTTIIGTAMTITATKTDDGGAWGKVELSRSGFMNARSEGQDQPTVEAHLPDDVGSVEPSRSPYPVIDVANAYELQALLELAAPGTLHGYAREADGTRRAWMSNRDGSWATAAGGKGEPAQVQQGGPQRLWDALDQIRSDWLADGWLQLYGAEVRIEPDGMCFLSRGSWRATIPALPLASTRQAVPSN